MKNQTPSEYSDVWVVQDETGEPIFCASWPDACHEHINDAINNHGIDDAAAWKVLNYSNGHKNTPSDRGMLVYLHHQLSFQNNICDECGHPDPCSEMDVAKELDDYLKTDSPMLIRDYRKIARLIGKIFFYGDFKAETHNERELEELLRQTGNFYETQESVDAANDDA